jgi:hypothetical protein
VSGGDRLWERPVGSDAVVAAARDTFDIGIGDRLVALA